MGYTDKHAKSGGHVAKAMDEAIVRDLELAAKLVKQVKAPGGEHPVGKVMVQVFLKQAPSAAQADEVYDTAIQAVARIMDKEGLGLEFGSRQGKKVVLRAKQPGTFYINAESADMVPEIDRLIQQQREKSPTR